MVTIRRAAPADLDALLELAAEYAAADGHEFEPAVARAGLGPLLDSDTFGVVWVATDPGDALGGGNDRGVDHDLVGYAAVTWGWSIEVGGLDVVLDEVYSRRRNTGVGSRLIDRLVRDCEDRGVRRIFLETERGNDAARRLYARHGFVADTSIWMARQLA